MGLSVMSWGQCSDGGSRGHPGTGGEIWPACSSPSSGWDPAPLGAAGCRPPSHSRSHVRLCFLGSAPCCPERLRPMGSQVALVRLLASLSFPPPFVAARGPCSPNSESTGLRLPPGSFPWLGAARGKSPRPEPVSGEAIPTPQHGAVDGAPLAPVTLCALHGSASGLGRHLLDEDAKPQGLSDMAGAVMLGRLGRLSEDAVLVPWVAGSSCGDGDRPALQTPSGH